MPEIFRPQDVRAIVFDVGGVLALDAPRYFLAELSVKEGVGLEELVSIWRRFFPELLKGKTTENEFWMAFINELNLEIPPEELLRRFKELIRLFILPDKEFIAYLHEFKAEMSRERPKEPVKFGILSNNVKEWIAEIDKEVDIPSLFDSIVYSCDEGNAKPDHASFLSIIKKLGVEPDEILFVDNKAKNVDAAKKLGMYGLVFTTPEDFKTEMIELKMVKTKEK